MRVGFKTSAASAVLLIYSGAINGGPPTGFDDWTVTAGAITTTATGGTSADSFNCPTGFTCASATTGAGFFQREITEETSGDSYFQTIITDEGPLSPTITPPPGIETTITGHAIHINLDPAHGGLLPSISNDTTDSFDFTATHNSVIGPLPPGHHTLIWTAKDEDNYSGTATQNIDIIPTASFTIDQTTKEGTNVTVTASLSGEAAYYPVTIPYLVTGSAIADPGAEPLAINGDHNAGNGEIIINEGTSGSITFFVIEDSIQEGEETVTFTMATPTNARLGNKSTHTITISEQIHNPRLAFQISQADKTTPLLTTTDGEITLEAIVTDTTTFDSNSFDWSQSNSTLIDPGCDQAICSVDPTNLAPGLYRVHISVTQNNSPNQTSMAETWLRIGTPPTLSNSYDKDGDGVNDLEEGIGDNDSDGIPNFLDVVDAAYLIPGYWETRYKSLKDKNVNNEHTPAAGELGWRITSADEHINYPMLIATEEGLKLSADSRNLWRYETLSGVAFSWADFNNIEPAIDTDDTELKHDEHFYVSLQISELPLTGATAKLVIPQAIAVESPNQQQATVRGYDEDFGWNDFVEDANNRIASAKRVGDYCPSPHSAAYQAGLIAGLECIQLTIEDGGANDNDGYSNGRIAFTGGLLFKQAVVHTATQTTDNAAETTGNLAEAADEGGTGPISLFLLSFAALALCFRHNSKSCN